MQPPTLGPPMDHLDGVGYAASRGTPTDHRVCRSESGVPLHGPGYVAVRARSTPQTTNAYPNSK
ncbi:hypothetical protein LguiA_036735 [Lonicera macranthoides]